MSEEFIARLRQISNAVYLAAEKDVADDIAAHLRDAADALERAERVVEAARRAHEQGRSAHNELIRDRKLKGHEYKGGCCGWSEFLDRERDALAVYDNNAGSAPSGLESRGGEVVGNRSSRANRDAGVPEDRDAVRARD